MTIRKARVDPVIVTPVGIVRIVSRILRGSSPVALLLVMISISGEGSTVIIDAYWVRRGGKVPSHPLNNVSMERGFLTTGGLKLSRDV